MQYRRERNRMHARLTRDRKKLFTSRLMQSIQHLERQNLIMRNRLDSINNNIEEHQKQLESNKIK
jgi:hypothetical protein